MSIYAWTPAAAGLRIVYLAYGGLCTSALAVMAARSAAPEGASAVVPLCLALLSGTGAAIWFLSRRLIGALRNMEETAKRSRSHFQTALDNMSQGLVLCDTQANLVAVNNRFLQLMGISSDRIRPVMSIPEIIRLQAEAGNMTMEVADILIKERLNRTPGSSGRLTMPFRAGELEVAYQPRPEGGWACTFEDVTVQKEAERRLEKLADMVGKFRLGGAKRSDNWRAGTGSYGARDSAHAVRSAQRESAGADSSQSQPVRPTPKLVVNGSQRGGTMLRDNQTWNAL